MMQRIEPLLEIGLVLIGGTAIAYAVLDAAERAVAFVRRWRAGGSALDAVVREARENADLWVREPEFLLGKRVRLTGPFRTGWVGHVTEIDREDPDEPLLKVVHRREPLFPASRARARVRFVTSWAGVDEIELAPEDDEDDGEDDGGGGGGGGMEAAA